jgi:hypothetical protein
MYSITTKWTTSLSDQSVPKTTSPMPLSSQNWFGLVKFAYNITLLNQIEKILLKYCSG